MNAMTIAHMAGVLTSAIQAADRLELDALKGPALADMDLDRIRDKRDCSTCINLARPARKGATMSDPAIPGIETRRLATSGLALHALRTQPARPDRLAGRSGHHRQLAPSGQPDHARPAEQHRRTVRLRHDRLSWLDARASGRGGTVRLHHPELA